MLKIFFITLLLSFLTSCNKKESSFNILQPISIKPDKIKSDDFDFKDEILYIPVTESTVKWGHLPNLNSKSIANINSTDLVIFDTISHESILEDQGRNPISFLENHNVDKNHILSDAIKIANSNIEHNFFLDGPHIVVGPIYVNEAEPGDILKVDVIDIIPRVNYGFISNRHGKGALPGEYPLGEKPKNRYDFKNISIFAKTYKKNNSWHSYIEDKSGKKINFKANPFMGIMGVAKSSEQSVHSVPPGNFGGNLDINDLGIGSTLYLPVQVKGALFYTGDPHLSQGDGEVALTALEQSLRVLFRLTLIKKESSSFISSLNLKSPFGETKKYWIPIGLNEDLDEAMKMAVRQSINFISLRYKIQKQTALAYLSAATTFEVSQVVDKTKGVHSLIKKSDFEN